MLAHEIEQPFDSIESAHDFLDLLAATVLDATKDIREHHQTALCDGQERRARATELALFKLKILTCQLYKSRRALNDLRMIRRLLHDERASVERELATL
jgi:hypothetical protein